MHIIQGFSLWVVFMLGMLAGILVLTVSIGRIIGKRKRP